MTYREKLKMEHPDCFDEVRWWGGCKGCPCDYGYKVDSICTTISGAGINKTACTRCWNQEIPGTEEKSTDIYEICDKIARCRNILMGNGFTSSEAYSIIYKLIPLIISQSSDVSISDVIKILNEEEQK